MGSMDGDSDEKPVRQVYLDAYWMDRYEVNNAQYTLCVKAGACTNPRWTNSSTRSNYYNNLDYGNYPVVNVDWNQAQTYCEWAGGSLPTEAQWEKAARGTDGRSFPWGEENPDCDLANYRGCTFDSRPVTDYQAGTSPYGALNMTGNVREWVYDWYGPYKKGETNNPVGPSSGYYRMIRGSSWYDDIKFNRSAFRFFYNPSITLSSIGFRCILPQPW